MKLVHNASLVKAATVQQWHRLLTYVALTLVVVLWAVVLIGHVALAADFYPLYFAAQRVLTGQSPYGVEATNALMLVWDAPFASAGVAYPLPLILLVVPLSLLALPVAAFIWLSLGFALSYACVLLVRRSSALVWFLPFAYWPLYQAVMLGQATAVWFGLAVMLIIAIHQDKRWITAVLIVLLVLKPQNGLLFALYGVYWLLRNHPKWLTLTVGLGGIMFLAALAIQPSWIPEWIEQVKRYSVTVRPVNLLIPSLIVPLALLRYPKPWWATVAIFQVILFPITDLYSASAFLLVWCVFPLPIALVGAGVSWLPVLLGMPPSVPVYTLALLVPLCVVGVWETRQELLWLLYKSRRRLSL